MALPRGKGIWECGQTRDRVLLCPAPVSQCALRRMDRGFSCNDDVPSAAGNCSGQSSIPLLCFGLLHWVSGVTSAQAAPWRTSVGCGVEPSSLLSHRKHLCLCLGCKNNPSPGPPKLEEWLHSVTNYFIDIGRAKHSVRQEWSQMSMPESFLLINLKFKKNKK